MAPAAPGCTPAACRVPRALAAPLITWPPQLRFVCVLFCLQGKIKSLEQIYLFSLAVKEYQIVDFFLGGSLKDEVRRQICLQNLLTEFAYKICLQQLSARQHRPHAILPQPWSSGVWESAAAPRLRAGCAGAAMHGPQVAPPPASCWAGRLHEPPPGLTPVSRTLRPPACRR